MSTQVVDPAIPLLIRYQHLPDTGETKFLLLYDGDQFPFTVRNENFNTLVGFYRHYFDTVDVMEVVL